MYLDAKEKMGMCIQAEKIKDLEERILGLKQSLVRDCNSIRKEREELLRDMDDKKSKLLISEKAEEIANEKKTLELQRANVVNLSNKLSSISKLKVLANELAHKRMLTLLDTINDFTNEMLTILFDEPMKIEFTVYKMTKSKDKVKPSIVYKIFYKGYELDSVDQLSGGEADRVSLALTCALFRFTKFPFLLLDEFASSLDLNTKETAIKTLKTFLGVGINQSKSILCISHDTVEGIYDHTIRL
jgi:DNA repair exonuclease SbcCD ATPase subunit